MKTINSTLLQRFSKALAAWLTVTALLNARADEPANHGQFTSKDYKFVNEAAEGGHAEIRLSEVALQKASDPAVKDFGQRMVTDHQKAADELKQLATQKGATLPEVPTKSENRATERLQELSGVDFDKAYMRDMVSDHKKVVKAFEKASENAEDQDLKSWATKTLPTLQDHLRMAQSIEANLSGVKPATKAE